MRTRVQRLLLAGTTLLVAVCGTGMLAVSAHAEGCANEQVRAEQPFGLGLPDCRAYELVSPQDKNNNNALEGHARASVSGDAVVYGSPGSFAEPKSTLLENRYVARRGASGWSSQNINEPLTPYTSVLTSPYEYLIFTPDLSKGLLTTPITPPLAAGALPGYYNLYVANIAAGSYRAVTTVAPGGEPFSGLPFQPIPTGVSADFSRVVFEQYANLTPGASGERFHVYEWVDGQLIMVDIPPEGVTLTGDDQVGAPVQQEVYGAFAGDVSHAVSTDGSRVFFTGGEPGRYISRNIERPEEAAGQLYLREVNAGKTVEVSASQRASIDPNGPQAARFWTASADGSRVFFTSRAELTENANTGAADNAPNLYEYDVENGLLTDLTVDTNPDDVNGAAVLGVVTAGEDGSYVYFVAEGDLAGAAVPGKPNLYLYHGGKVTFIATLVNGDPERLFTGDKPDWSREDRFESEGEGGPGTHNVRVTSDGTRLAFVSEGSLTGYDNEPAESDKCGYEYIGEERVSLPCTEVYLFDATADKLTCVSCNPSGSQPVGSSNLGGHEEVKETFSVFEFSQYYVQRNFTEDGSRLFFQSKDALVPLANDGRQNVYEYQNGHVHLISDGTGNKDSYFLDASPNGDNVFIATADQLLPQDQDDYVDVYDVRVGGGFPVSASAPECDNGDSCKPPVSPQPGLFGAAASATFSGAGNLAPSQSLQPATKQVVKPKGKPKAKPRRCRKGFVKKHGRCVKLQGKRSTVRRGGGL